MSSSTHSRSTVPVVHKLLEAATRGITPLQQHYQNNLHTTPAAVDDPPAAILARSASQAGFLQKLGANIPEFKRRFFVLKPETNLYYFLSPNDTSPRGKFDLEGSRIQELEPLPDGRCRFSIVLSDQKRIVLEARSQDVAKEWMRHLEEDRVSTLKSRVDTLTSESVAQKNQIQDLEKQIDNFRMVEKDRDGAIEDAKRWKAQFERLDEALRLLTQRVRKPPPTDLEQGKPVTINNIGGYHDDDEEEKKESHPNTQQQHEDATPQKNNQSKKPELALLDEVVEDDDNQDIQEIMQVPGTYFSALSNACQQQRKSLRLASIEAETAVEDVQQSNEELQAMKKRMEKAEKSLCKLWEENCAIRKTLKQKKREKRVLVREVKALQQQIIKENQNKPRSRGPSPTEEEGFMEDTLIGSDEERLIIELEEHVASSIRLHDRFLASNMDLNTSMEGSDVATNCSLNDTAAFATIRSENGPGYELSGRQSPLRPTALQPKLMSLFDDESDSESNEDDENDHGQRGGDDDGLNEYESVGPSIVSSVGAEMGDPMDCGDSIASSGIIPVIRSEESTPERPNPVLELDKEDPDEADYDNQPNLCAASSQSASSKSAITDNGKATSRLVCPLADVVGTQGSSVGLAQSNDELRVYHLTFYSTKIGLQFQKAPPAPTRPKGLLTAAMTADLAGDANGSEKTASELRSVAAISSLASHGYTANNDEVCPVATPEHIVLVCGFQGFDDSGMNQRPKLGARLVAFDGISVEIGHWTFDSIRKAIKARGRPLTLSFRNDFLTTEQRAVLTKAVMEVDAKAPPPRATIQYGGSIRPPSTTPSINSAISHETDYFVNDGDNQKEEETDHSANAADSTCCRRPISSSSVSSHGGRLRRFSSNSVSTHQSNFRSFSEAGSSSVMSATTLVANLMKGVSDRKEKFTPEYLHREPEKLENTPQHQDFQSNLL